MNEPFTPRAKRVLARARRIAEASGHSYIGPEHVLLSLLGEPDGIVPGLIESAGFNMKDLNEKVTKAVKDAWKTPSTPAGSAKTFQELFDSARKSPAYEQEGLDELLKEVSNLFCKRQSGTCYTYDFNLGRFPDGWSFQVVNDWNLWMAAGRKTEFGRYATPEEALEAFLKYRLENQINVAGLMS